MAWTKIVGLVALLTGLVAWTSRLQPTAPPKFSTYVEIGPLAFSQLATDAPNGVVTYCSNCQPTAPCTSGGTGAIAVRVAGGWACDNGSGGTVLPGTQTLSAGGTVTADACGGVKRLTSVSAVTTNLLTTITTASAANAGCRMTVCNLGVTHPITLDANDTYVTRDGLNTVLRPLGSASSCVDVVSTGDISWFEADHDFPTTYDVRAFGARCDGVADDTVAIQAAIDTVVSASGGTVVVTGNCVVSTSLVIASVAGFVFHGVGSKAGVSGVGGTSVRWIGNATSPMFLVQDVRDSLFEGFYVNSGPSLPLREVFNFQNLTATAAVTPTHNVIRQVVIDGTTSAGLTYGVRWSDPDGTTSDANNDVHTLDDVRVSNYTTAAFSIEHSQSVAHQFRNCSCSGNGAGDSCVKTSNGSFSWYGGGGGGHDVADFDLGSVNREILLEGGDWEGSARLLKTGQSAAGWAVTVRNHRWAAGSLHADKDMIYYGQAGPLLMEGNALCTDVNPATCEINLDGPTAPIRAAITGNDLGLWTVTGSGSPLVVRTPSTVGWSILFAANHVADATGAGVGLRALAVGDTTPAVWFTDLFETANTAPTTITQFDGGFPGHRFTLKCADTNTTIADGANIQLAGSVNYLCVVGTDLTFRHDGTQWREVGRSVN